MSLAVPLDAVDSGALGDRWLAGVGGGLAAGGVWGGLTGLLPGAVAAPCLGLAMEF